MTKPA